LPRISSRDRLFISPSFPARGASGFVSAILASFLLAFSFAEAGAEQRALGEEMVPRHSRLAG
jgi:hypothetical protein